MTSRLAILPLLLASQILVAQEQPQASRSPGPGSLAPASRPALLTSSPVNQVLPADSAFQLQSFAASADSILLHWDIQPGYYLYRKSIMLTDSEGQNLTITLPPGRQITDEYFGTVEVYYDSLEVQAAVQTVPTKAQSSIRQVQLQLEYQGCAEELYCYPPQHKQIDITLP